LRQPVSEANVIRFPPKEILVPVDFSKPSLIGLETAKRVARRTGASLNLVYVEALAPSLAMLETDGEETPLPAIAMEVGESRRRRGERLREAAGQFPAERLSIESTTGWPQSKLPELIRSRGAGLLVMGTHGWSGLERALFGSTAEGVIRRSECPVLAVHESNRPFEPSRVLVPCNLRDYSEAALRYALAFAAPFGARVAALFVSETAVGLGAARLSLERHLQEALGPATAERLELRVRSGEARAEILREAAEGYDLIALSAHRRTFSTDWVLGSTAERVLRHTSLPLLAVPSEGRRGTGEGPRGWIRGKLF
jgi:nucleotide-binding universal stress UspA family protein